MGIIKEFKEFLEEYKVMGLAVAFIIAVAATALVQSLVNNIIMPIGWGAFLAAVINFIIIAFAVFLIAKYIMKEEKVTKK
jgi:large conductance mechanosensitive channel